MLQHVSINRNHSRTTSGQSVGRDASSNSTQMLFCKQRRLLKHPQKSEMTETKFASGLDVIFASDMRQLEPIEQHKRPVYSENCPEFKDWVNCHIELNGMHHDSPWGRLLFHFRDGNATAKDIENVNKTVAKHKDLPENIGTTPLGTRASQHMLN